MIRFLARAIGLLLLVVLLGTGALFVRALGVSSQQIEVPPAPARAVDDRAVAERLAASLRFPTISYGDPARLPAEAFVGFRAWLAETYPRLHETLSLELVSEHSMLFTWPGGDASLDPILLLAHIDVVPAEEPERWTHPPFAGVIDGGRVWGRGAIDDKGSLVMICEAVERLLEEGFEPRRSVMLAFGHDEEVGGPEGAVRMAELLDARGIRAALVIDEGLALLEAGILPGLTRPVAAVGIAEKGSATLDVVARAPGGHSSTPPRHTAAGRLAQAVVEIERHPMPLAVGGVAETFFRWLAPEMPLAMRVPLASFALLARPIDWVASGQPAFNAMLRTTTAVTMLSGSPKENVLPNAATATVNFRLIPGDTAEIVRERIRERVAADDIEVDFRGTPRDPSPVSPADAPPFALLQRTVGEIFPEAIVAPALVVAGTDSRHYTGISDHVFRFVPFRFGPEDLALPHGIDEHIAIEQLGPAVRFYARLIENASEAWPAR